MLNYLVDEKRILKIDAHRLGCLDVCVAIMPA